MQVTQSFIAASSTAATPTSLVRRWPVGAEVQAEGGTHFRLWAPQRQQVTVVLETSDANSLGSFPLEKDAHGYFAGFVAEAEIGMRYRFKLDGDDYLYPDPVSRFQPEGPHGPSQLVDPHTFQWTDQAWRGVSPRGQVIYELHVGTFTPEGTWAAAQNELAALADLGVTLIEVMPVADFAGSFGWGYDGVNLFAPTRLYGEPDDFRRFVDAAHALGIGVILDVVYNHLGPDGNYLKQFSEAYFSTKHETEWGEAINYDGENCAPVREYFVMNGAYWIQEYHLDGLRLDATQSIFDDSAEHILLTLQRAVRQAANGRGTYIVAENEPQNVKLVQPPERGGYGLDALWNDDFHHSAAVAMTGRSEAYYTDYLGNPQEFISAVKYGYLYQGQWYRWQQRRRGTADLTLPPTAYVNFLQNHDQIANSGRGERCHCLTSPGQYRALTALLLLQPGTPMLFQGQEFGASSPFCYFADFEGELKELVRTGRLKELAQFRTLATPETQAVLADPGDPQTFLRCKLDLRERERHAGIYQLHRDLLRLRRKDTAFSQQQRGCVDGAVIGANAFVLRFFGTEENVFDDRLLIVNLGADQVLNPAPEPLLAPPIERQWATRWSSEHPVYGGLGTPPLETTENWLLPGHATVVLKAVRRTEVPEASLVHPNARES